MHRPSWLLKAESLLCSKVLQSATTRRMPAFLCNLVSRRELNHGHLSLHASVRAAAVVLSASPFTIERFFRAIRRSAWCFTIHRSMFTTSSAKE